MGLIRGDDENGDPTGHSEFSTASLFKQPLWCLGLSGVTPRMFLIKIPLWCKHRGGCYSCYMSRIMLKGMEWIWIASHPTVCLIEEMSLSA